MKITTGMTYTFKLVVKENMTAAAYQDGLPEVFATPEMIAAMELAGYKCVQDYLPEGHTTVGTHVNVSHELAAGVGTEVTVTATIVEIDRRRIDFNVVAESEKGILGRGLHSRFVIDKEAFEAKL